MPCFIKIAAEAVIGAARMFYKGRGIALPNLTETLRKVQSINGPDVQIPIADPYQPHVIPPLRFREDSLFEHMIIKAVVVAWSFQNASQFGAIFSDRAILSELVAGSEGILFASMLTDIEISGKAIVVNLHSQCSRMAYKATPHSSLFGARNHARWLILRDTGKCYTNQIGPACIPYSPYRELNGDLACPPIPIEHSSILSQL